MQEVLPFEKAFDYEHLFIAMKRCQKGVSWKPSVSRYLSNSIINISKLSESVLNSTYIPGKFTQFITYSPKQRVIVAANFKDRIVQRAFCDFIVYPKLTRSLIFGNVACQKGKGTDCGRSLLKQYLRRIYQTSGTDFYYLQLDVKGYYPNMDHKYINSLFKQKLTHKEYELYLLLMNHYYPQPIGYNPGSQLVQIAGIACLDKLDHYCKEILHCRYYIRYMDDVIILHNNRTFLCQVLNDICSHLAQIGFQANPKKTKIGKQITGIDFLGFTWAISRTGKVLVKVNNKSFKRAKQHWNHMISSASMHAHGLSYSDAVIAIESYESYLSRANCNKKIFAIILNKKEALKCRKYTD